MKVRWELLKNFDWRGALTRDIGAKLGAGALAILLWLTVVSQQTGELTIKVGVDYLNLPADLALAEGTLDQVTVTFKGAQQTIGGLNSENFPRLQIDAAGMKLGKNTRSLTATDFDLVNGVQAVRIEPAQLEAIIEPRREVAIPVRVMLQGSPAQGYVVGEQRVTPATVRVAGPESLLRTLDYVFTEEISVEGVSQALNRKDVAVNPHHARLLLLDTLPVEVTVTIVPELIRKTLTEVPVTLRGAPAGIASQINPARVTIEVEGPRDVIEGMGATGVTCYLDVAQGDLANPQLSVDKPDRMTVLRIDPPSIKIEH